MPSQAAPTEPLVTVGLPVYNSERYLSQSIESLLGQTFREFVLVISDNASTDRTPEICLKYARDDSRVRYYRNERNIGLSANFNRVFQLAASKYLKWSSSDDYWAADMLADAVSVMESDPTIVLCYPKTTLVAEPGGGLTPYEDRLHLMEENPVARYLRLLENIRLVHQHQGLIRTDAIRRTSLLGTHTGSDINFLAELCLYGKFFEVPKYQYFRRFHPSSSSWDRGSERHQALRYHAKGVKRIPFSVWKYHLSFIRGVLRSPHRTAQKARMLRELLKRMYWDGRSLVIEPFQDLVALLRSG